MLTVRGFIRWSLGLGRVPMLAYEQQLMIAIELAVKYHADQYDKIGLPYIMHPLAVMHAFAVRDLRARIVAVCHDLLEDTECTVEILLAAGIAADLLDAVVAITKRPNELLGNYYLRVKANPLALRVKYRDIEHNLSSDRMKHLPAAVRTRLREKYRLAFLALE